MKLSTIVFGLAIVSILLFGVSAIYYENIGEYVDVPCYDKHGNEIKDLVCKGNENRALANGYLLAGFLLSISLTAAGMWLYSDDL